MTKKTHTEDNLRQLIDISKDCSPQHLAELDEVERTVRTARAIVQVTRAISDEVIEMASQLQNTPIGFLTDNKAGYPKQMLRPIIQEAVLRGARFLNNEFNIIGGRLYLAKNYYRRQIADWPTVKGQPIWRPIGVPVVEDNMALVSGSVSVQFRDGNVQQWTFEGPAALVVRVNKGMGADGCFGKAEKKAYQAVYNELSGMDLGDDVDDLPEVAPAEVIASEVSDAPEGQLFDTAGDASVL